jgi:hypothetical protein
MTTATYTYSYSFNGNPIAGGELNNQQVANATLEDIDSNPSDHMTTVGELVSYTAGALSVSLPLRGVTQDGDPIVESGSNLFVLSNTDYPASTILSATSGEYTFCFAAGTLISTPDGEAAVETLKIGDLVMTADGRAVPVKWIGRQTVTKFFTPVERFAPVRVTAGALGGGLPHTDLVLTSDHALILDGLAINAGALVNGTTILLDPVDSLPDRVTYHHVETEGHEVILANGAPAETFVDYVTRRAFDNHAEFVALYGDERVIDEMPYLRISSPRLVPPSLRARLDDPRAA